MCVFGSEPTAYVVMHGAFRPCAVVDIPRERIDVIFAYGKPSLRSLLPSSGVFLTDL